MKISRQFLNPARRFAAGTRRGAVIVLVVAILIMVFAFTAFTVDVGYITLTRGQLQNAADAAAKAAAMELPAAIGKGATLTTDQVKVVAGGAAVEVAAANRAGDRDEVFADSVRDVQYGRVTWDSSSGTWQKEWDVTPFNMAKVTLRRNQSETEDGQANTAGDQPLPLFFAPVIGHKNANLSVSSTAALVPGVGFKIRPGSGLKVGILPIALDIGTWNNLLAGNGNDQYNFNPDTGEITPNSSDGIKELNLYPTGSNLLPPGNRGTVDLGSPNNSTADLNRQILEGLNEFDLSFFPNGEIRTDNGPLYINGDTGLSAGIKEELDAIKGEPRLIPIFTEVSGPGNNATYTVVKFVGIRILYVKLTGSPSQKCVIVQPAPYMAPTVIPGEVTEEVDSYFSPVSLIE
ncbi:MAG: pilus assembly protein TadG-related protein [Planctomycetaceae bacterium]